MDELASMMGCKPDLWRALLTGDWTLFRALLLGPNAPCVFIFFLFCFASGIVQYSRRV
jgi:hypothetical protein